MLCKWENQDVNSRLSGTIVRYRREPVYVEVANHDTLHLYDITKEMRKPKYIISPKDVEFDVSTPPLGYVNYPYGVVYLSRSPRRVYKQGLASNNTCFYSLPSQTGDIRRADGRLTSQEVYDCIVGNYPDVNSVLKQLRSGKVVSKAISRDVAFQIDSIGMVSVYYDQVLCGHILPNKKKVTIPDSNIKWIVKDRLEEYGLEVE